MDNLLDNLSFGKAKGNEDSQITPGIPDLIPEPKFNLKNNFLKLSKKISQPPVISFNLDDICGEIDKGVANPFFVAEQDKIILPSLQKELSRKPSTKRESSPKTKRILTLEDRVDSLEKDLIDMQHQLTLVIQQISNSIFTTPEPEKFNQYECIEEETDSNLSKSKSNGDSSYKQRHPKQILLNRQFSLMSPSIHSSLSKQSSGRDSSLMTSLSKMPWLNLKNQLKSQPVANDNENDSGSEFSNDETSASKSKDIDIAFLYADVLVYKNKKEIMPLSSEQTLSPDKMYEDIVEELEKTKKQFTILKRPLNRESLLKVLFERPKVLFLNCHGDKKRVDGKLSSHFCFESVEQLALLEEFNEQMLCALLRDHRCQVQLVVISACHSSNLGQQLSDAGIPVVVSINTSVKILEKAAYAFNKIFLDLLLAGHSPQEAFNAGRNNVSSAGEENNKICCCNHDHQNSCLWFKYKEKHGLDKAHMLHTFTCKCFKNKSVKPMEHNYDCVGFLNFYNTLINSVEGCESETPENKLIRERLIEKNKELIVDEKLGDPDFLKSPILPQDKNYKNKLCCCQCTLPHDESQKFIIKGKEPVKELNELTPLETPIFQKRSSGKVQQNLPISPEKPLPSWLKDSSLLLDRNIEIHKIISCLDSRQQQIQKRFLQVHGNHYSGRKPVVFRAVRYILERSALKFSDGVFLVDLEKVDSVQSMIFKFSTDLKLAHPSPNLETLIEDIEKRKMLIIVINCEIILEKNELNKAACDFFKTIIKKTDFLKIILITEEAALRSFQYEWHCNIEIKPISTEMKVKLFKIQMEIENKMGLLKDINVDDHPVFELADNWFISRIVHQLNSQYSLDDIQAELQEQLLRKQSNESSEKLNKPTSKKNFELAITIRSLYCSDILNTVPVHYKLEKNLIFFLAQTPAGICYTEIQLLCNIYKSWFGTKFDGFLSELLLATEAAYTQRLQSNNSELSNSGLVIVSKNENIKNERHYKIDIDQRLALDLLLDAKSQNRKLTITTKTHNDFIAITIEFMGSIARAVLQSIRAKKRGGEVDHKLVTAHLGVGMWWRYTDEEYQLTIDDHAEERFSSYYLTNFKSLLNQEMLESNFTNIWSIDKLSQESEFIFDLCLCVPSILAELNRFQEALEVIEVCRKFGGTKKLLLHGYLDLMHASIQIYTDKIDGISRVTQLLHSARATFQVFDQSEGIAETYYVEALLHMNNFNRHIHSPHQFTHQDSFPTNLSFSPLLQSQSIMHQHSLPSNKTNELQFSSFLSKRIYDVTTLTSCLTKALQEFGKMHDGQEIPICNKIFGKAKTLMVQAEFLINNSADLTTDQKEQCEFSREQCLEQLAIAEELFNRQNNHKYIAYCKCLQAKVKIAIKDELISQKHDLVNARELIDQAVKLFGYFHDEKIIKEIKQVKNKILHYMRAGSTNLFTFAKAWPIVEKNDMGVIMSLGEFTRTKFELMPKIERNFGDLGKEIQVKYDLLTEEVLRYVAEFGSRVLHLTSDVIGEGCLCIEGEIGMCKRMGVEELREFFCKTLKIDQNSQKMERSPLPVDVVVLAIPDSTDLGQVFQEFGVKHVVTFEFQEHFRGKDDDKEAQLMPIRYNYMYTFCVEFYTALVEEQTINQAFERGLYAVEKNEEMQFELIWQHRDPFGELGIKPVLLNMNSSHHNDPLFSSKAVEGDRFYFGPGQVIDTTKARGLLQNIEKSKEAYIGHQDDMFNVLHWLLAAKPNTTHLVHVRGVRSVGKTRFLKEVAYYLYQRHKFESKIQYVDLGKIKTEAELKALLTQMKVFETQKGKQGQKDDREILLIFDNADSLPQEVFLSFEARLIELMSKNASMRAMVSSRRSLPFKTFLRANEQEQLNQSLNQIGARKRSQVPQRKYWRRELILNPLDDIQSVDLILNTCQKQMTREYLNAEDDQLTIQDLLEENVRKCKNLPLYLIEYAHKLSKADSYQDVRVHTVQEDNLKHKTSHFKSKPKTKVTIETIKNQSDDESDISNNKKRIDRRSGNLLGAKFGALAMGPVQEISESRGSGSVYLRDSESETMEHRSQRAFSNTFQNDFIASNMDQTAIEEGKDFIDNDLEESLEPIHLQRNQSAFANPEEYFIGRDQLVSDDRLFVDADNYHQHNQVKRMHTGSSNTNSTKSQGKKQRAQVAKTKTNPRKVDVFKHKKKSKYELHGSGNKKEVLEEIDEQEEEQKIPVDIKKTNSAEAAKAEKVRKKKLTKQSKLAQEEQEFNFAKPKHE